MANRKTCPVCRKSLSTASFNESSQSADGLARVCRSCTNARRRQLDRQRPPSRAAPRVGVAMALRQGDVTSLRKLIRRGAKPHWSWVCETMRGGHLPAAKLLLESGAERNIFALAAMADVPGLRRRVRRVPTEARMVVDMDPSCERVTPLHVACSSDFRLLDKSLLSDQVRVSEFLCVNGADFDVKARYRGIDDATPLFCACWTSGNRALVQFLLGQGAEAKSCHLMAALGHFQRHHQPAVDIAELLLEHGVRIDGEVPGDRTPLQAFAHQGIHKAVTWLIAHGADVNARGPGGRTAAHLAAERNTGPKTLAVLVNAGADLSIQDDDGRTVIDLAKLNQKHRLVEWIKRRTQKRR